MIDERPQEIEERKRLGDWEGDTVIGKDRSWAILTMVERKSGYLKIYRLPYWKKCHRGNKCSHYLLEESS